jgi:site-specific DNA-adenine methylase
MINLMPPHKVYIETHAGSAAVMRHKRPAKVNIALEIDTEQYLKLFDVLTQGPGALLQIWNVDALDYLRSFTPYEDTLIYADPPYLPSTRKTGELYKHELTEEDHVNLLKKLRSMWPCMVMISGYESELYNDMLNDWNYYSFQTMTRAGMATECIWFNYRFPSVLHDYSYLGSTFRERERISRQQNRWIKRLHELPPVEREAMLNRIKEEFL